MIVAFALIGGAAVVAWLLPHRLHALASSRIDPTVAMAWWFATCVAVAAAITAGVTLLVLPGHGPATAVLAWLHGCWTAMRHHNAPVVNNLLGLAGVSALTLVAIRTGVAARRRRSKVRADRRRRVDLLRVALPGSTGTADVVWLPHHEPMAYSVAGRPSLIVATSGLREQLSARQVAAVIAHASAHLRGRHHLLVGLAEALAWALPFLPVTRELPGAIRTLVEMAADRAAAQACGPAAVRGALTRLGGCAAVPGALAIAEDDVSWRVARLARAGRYRRTTRALGTLIAVPGALALPALAALLILFAGSFLYCPMLHG